MLNPKEIRENLHKLSPDERKKLLALLDKVDIDISTADHTLTGTKPSGFELEGRFYPAEHNRDIFLKVCEIAAGKNPNQHHLFLEITGRTRQYFSRNPNELSTSDYRKINGTNLYADLNANAKDLNSRSQKVIAKFGLDLVSFKVI